jgi:hypothetical protein
MIILLTYLLLVIELYDYYFNYIIITLKDYVTLTLKFCNHEKSNFILDSIPSNSSHFLR